MHATPEHATEVAESLPARRHLADRVRYVADVFALWSDASHRLAERIQPTARPSSDYRELVEALQREALEDHNRQVARQMYGPGLRVVR